MKPSYMNITTNSLVPSLFGTQLPLLCHYLPKLFETICCRITKTQPCGTVLSASHKQKHHCRYYDTNQTSWTLPTLSFHN